jgi:hypothetical protein
VAGVWLGLGWLWATAADLDPPHILLASMHGCLADQLRPPSIASLPLHLPLLACTCPSSPPSSPFKPQPVCIAAAGQDQCFFPDFFSAKLMSQSAFLPPCCWICWLSFNGVGKQQKLGCRSADIEQQSGNSCWMREEMGQQNERRRLNSIFHFSLSQSAADQRARASNLFPLLSQQLAQKHSALPAVQQKQTERGNGLNNRCPGLGGIMRLGLPFPSLRCMHKCSPRANARLAPSAAIFNEQLLAEPR